MLAVDPCLTSSGFGILASVEERDEFYFFFDYSDYTPTLSPS